MKKWSDLPEAMQNEAVRPYFEIVRKKGCSRFFKRLFDIVVAVLLLLILIVPIGIIAIIVKCDSKGPVFYRQIRISTYNKPFKVYKFRTMVVDADKIGSLVTTKNDNRITKVGKILRKTRLDELPQLFNVLDGTMSFVGTRPEVPKYVDMYKPEYLATLLLPPGVTSLASIKFKNESDIIDQNNGRSVDDVYVNDVLPIKMKYNLLYLENFNVFRDIGLMVKTFFTMFKK